MNEDIGDVMLSRKITRKITGNTASHGDPLADILAELENSAAVFFLGIDEDPDGSDLDVFP